MFVSMERATKVASQPMATDSGVQGVVDGAHRRALGDLAQRRGRRILPLGQAVDAVVEQHDVDVEVAAEGMDQVVATDAQAVAVARDHPHREVRRGPSAPWPRPGPGRGSSGCRRYSCSRGSGWSSRCPDTNTIFSRGRRAKATPSSSGRESNNRRTRGTSALPGRWQNRWPSIRARRSKYQYSLRDKPMREVR